MYVYGLGALLELQFRRRRRRCPTPAKAKVLAMVGPAVAMGDVGVVCMPLAANVPAMPNAHLVNCPRCGELCWRRDAQPGELDAACTRCALRAGVAR